MNKSLQIYKQIQYKQILTWIFAIYLINTKMYYQSIALMGRYY